MQEDDNLNVLIHSDIMVNILNMWLNFNQDRSHQFNHCMLNVLFATQTHNFSNDWRMSGRRHWASLGYNTQTFVYLCVIMTGLLFLQVYVCVCVRQLHRSTVRRVYLTLWRSSSLSDILSANGGRVFLKVYRWEQVPQAWMSNVIKRSFNIRGRNHPFTGQKQQN